MDVIYKGSVLSNKVKKKDRQQILTFKGKHAVDGKI